MRFISRLGIVGACCASAVALGVQPAQATVHEIVGQWCSGHEPLEPRGISRGDAKNFAMPLFASGALQLTPFNGGVLIDFDFDHPAIKIISVGDPLQIGPGLWIEPFIPDPAFPAFAHCPGFAP